MLSTRFIRKLAFSLIIACGLLSGCQTVQYYGQAIYGQLDLLNRREPVSDLIADPQTPQALKSRLRLATEMLEFAANDLYLPVDGQYRTYVKLQRPYVIWNVFAAPEFALDPKTWCYPVAGCTAYRGYFNEKKARHYAQILADSGYDVMIGGVTAYSTLGWFNDSLLSTFINGSESRIAALIFHELAHQAIYVSDDTAFNESFATAVAHEGMRRWYASRGSLDKHQRYMEAYRQEQEMVALIAAYRSRLAELYRSQVPANKMRRQKAALFEALRQEFESRLREEKNLQVFAHWFDATLNNAKLISIAAYHDYVPAFGLLLETCQYDLKRFYRKCSRLAGLDPAERRGAMQDLLQLSAPSRAVKGLRHPLEMVQKLHPNRTECRTGSGRASKTSN